MPTAILSNHMGFPHYFIDDYTDRMRVYIENWQLIDLLQGILALSHFGNLAQDQVDILRRKHIQTPHQTFDIIQVPTV